MWDLLTNIVGESPFEAVEDEPAFLPRLDLAPHLHQVALAHLLSEDDLVAGVHTVAGRLDVGAQVELFLPDGQVASHGTGLDGAKTREDTHVFKTFSVLMVKMLKEELKVRLLWYENG